jgi:hypothetical protein
VCQLRRIATRRAAGRLRAKNLDHADHGAKQPHQRARRRNGGQRAEAQFQPVGHDAPGAFHDGAQIVFGATRVGVDGTQAAGQHFAQRRVLLQLGHHVRAGNGGAGHTQHFVQQARRRHLAKVLRLMKRSMTMARARTEQAIRGQIGQPAACMMENKWKSLRANEMLRDYGVRVPVTTHRTVWITLCKTGCPSGAKPHPNFGFDRLMTKAAVKNPMKSTTFDQEIVCCGWERADLQPWLPVVEHSRCPTHMVREVWSCLKLVAATAMSRRIWACGALCRAVADALDARFNPVTVSGRSVVLPAPPADTATCR